MCPGFTNAWSGPDVGRLEILVATADVQTARDAPGALDQT
jgi:hypothetical protein